ncbi:MAG: hypothetical protein J7L03_01605 [Caldisericaceae bacterium]|nr:hypothetical protein [Caldisericaceae bacterium]
MKKIGALLLLTILLAISGCGNKPQSTLPPLKTSGALVPNNGTAVYEIFDGGKKKGEETITFETRNGIVKVRTDISLATVYLDEKTLLPVKIEAGYTVNKVPSRVKIVFTKNNVSETIVRNGKSKTFDLPVETPMYPDDVLHFVLQGTDFNFTKAYIYDFFPYTSLEVPCTIENLGKETIEINGKKEDAVHLVADFGKKKRDYWISAKTPHLLLKREENGVLFTLKKFSGN